MSRTAGQEPPPAEHLREFHELTPGSTPPLGFVWGNCQAESLRRMIAPAAAEHGVRMVRIPPVHEITERQRDHLLMLLPSVATLVAQPVGSTFRGGGFATDELVAGLDGSARVLRLPNLHFEGIHPYQVYGHGADGARVDAPLTAYHDVRVARAAVDGLDVEAAVGTLTSGQVRDEDVEQVRRVGQESLAELDRREQGLDVLAGPVLRAALADPQQVVMHTVNHPANAVLSGWGQTLLSALGWDGGPAVPEHEMLGSTASPVEPAVLRAWGKDERCATGAWVLGGTPTPWEQVVAAHLGLYRERPDVARDVADRYADRLPG